MLIYQKEITNKQLSYDLTMRTVEVEDVIDTSLSSMIS